MNVVSQIASDDLYHYGFNGQMKVNEWAGVGNHNTAEWWEYDTRTGRRLNQDPKPNPSTSPYSAFDNSPIWIGDPLGDTPMIRGQAEALNKTLTDKGGTQDDPAHQIIYKHATLVPALNKSGAIVGYNVFDNTQEGSNMPIMQIDAGDLADFKSNYSNYMLGASMYYVNGEPSDGKKNLSAGIATKDPGLVAKGLGQEWTDPANIVQAVVGTALALEVKPSSGVQASYQRFYRKIPANSKSSATMQTMRGGGAKFTATSPGKVPNSRAVYEKIVNSSGVKVKYTKTTIAPDGTIIHTKLK